MKADALAALTILFPVIEMPVDSAHIPDTCERIAALAAETGLDEQGCFQVQVVMAEALNNIVNYAFADTKLDPIHIHCQADDSYFEITAIDNGRPLDMLPSDRFPEPDSEGGRGWPIILSWMDAVEYQTRTGENQLTLKKAFS